ncbi:hypothetical protein [Pelagicoccus enzymogenes]|uniref:hypothetical protein n=1 Tax=Pelagicoccus enzymogenes TaxID=2773457 RepID=UPI0028119ADE|nr:hypothetical protein [Pelagicoccus enzymogenes]
MSPNQTGGAARPETLISIVPVGLALAPRRNNPIPMWHGRGRFALSSQELLGTAGVSPTTRSVGRGLYCPSRTAGSPTIPSVGLDLGPDRTAGPVSPLRAPSWPFVGKSSLTLHPLLHRA